MARLDEANCTELEALSVADVHLPSLAKGKRA